jgi:hypothetical protein
MNIPVTVYNTIPSVFKDIKKYFHNKSDLLYKIQTKWEKHPNLMEEISAIFDREASITSEIEVIGRWSCDYPYGRPVQSIVEENLVKFKTNLYVTNGGFQKVFNLTKEKMKELDSKIHQNSIKSQKIKIQKQSVFDPVKEKIKDIATKNEMDEKSKLPSWWKQKKSDNTIESIDYVFNRRQTLSWDYNNYNYYVYDPRTRVVTKKHFKAKKESTK